MSNQEAVEKRIDGLLAQLDKFEKNKNKICEDLRAQYESRSLAMIAGIAKLEKALPSFENAADNKWDKLKKPFTKVLTR